MSNCLTVSNYWVISHRFVMVGFPLDMAHIYLVDYIVYSTSTFCWKIDIDIFFFFSDSESVSSLCILDFYQVQRVNILILGTAYTEGLIMLGSKRNCVTNVFAAVGLGCVVGASLD